MVAMGCDAGQAEVAEGAAAAPAPKAGAYRPPRSTGALAAMMRAERDADTVGITGKVSAQAGAAALAKASGARVIPGMAPPPAESKSAAKNR